MAAPANNTPHCERGDGPENCAIEITPEMVSAAEQYAYEALSCVESGGYLAEASVEMMLRVALEAGGFLVLAER